MDALKLIAQDSLKAEKPAFEIGDTIRVDVKIREGERERIQAFEGLVVNKHGGGVSATFTVRKKSGSVGVSRTFPVNSPVIDSIVVVKKGLVRRKKLSGFLRGMKKEYKVKERN